ncbi:MAG: VTT domain-containing protein [Mariprofundaceae bacterium]
MVSISNSLHRCYQWTLSWAEHPQARLGLFLIAVIEASVFPIPPDILLIALALGKPQQSLHFATIATIGSTIGAIIGFLIGMFLYTAVALPIIEFYGAGARFAEVQSYFVAYGVAFVLVAGFSPIPFKLVTIAAGAFALPFMEFVIAALIARAARFYLEAIVLQWGGERLRAVIEQYFGWLTTLVVLLVIAGFMVLWL